jgi:hypothetical protein
VPYVDRYVLILPDYDRVHLHHPTGHALLIAIGDWLDALQLEDASQ